jgi:uncharacterized damage-inducible protein DinB
MQGLYFVQQMARYNQWMNVKVYAAAIQLSAEQLAQERGAFFGSILGTLNHLLVADTLWLKRFANHSANYAALAPVVALPMPSGLDQIIFSDFTQLAERRSLLDKAIDGMVAACSAADLDHCLAYKNTKGIASERNFFELLMHFFNHQTHHRGQLSTLLLQAGVDLGVTDLLMLPNA